MTDLIAVVAAYLLGSIPFSLLIARRRGVDLRTAGSGNVGATNVFRTAGVGPGIGALALDVAKGSAAVLIAARVGTGLSVPVAAAVAAIVGHVAPVWLRFRGGKGVATAAGAFAVLTPMAVGIAVATFLMRRGRTTISETEALFTLTVKMGLGHDVNTLMGPTFSTYLRDLRLLSLSTAAKGTALEVSYDCRLIKDGTADDLVSTLNKLEGVQDVEFERKAADGD